MNVPFFSNVSRYDQEGFALDSQSLTETRSVGSGAKMNWKTLSDVKNEHMGHGEKVQCTRADIHARLTYMCTYTPGNTHRHTAGEFI